MRRSIHLAMALSLLMAPGLVLAEEAKAVSGTAEAAMPADAPELPSSDGVEGVPAEGLKDAQPAEVEVPKEDPAKLAPKAAQPEAKPSRFKFGNFALGFLGGALLGGAYGVLSSGGKGSDVMATNAAIYGGAAALVLGFTGLFLGATTPEEAKPPKVEGALPFTPMLVLATRF